MVVSVVVAAAVVSTGATTAVSVVTGVSVIVVSVAVSGVVTSVFSVELLSPIEFQNDTVRARKTIFENFFF